MSSSKCFVLVSVAGVFVLFIAVATSQYPSGTGSGTTTRYWDCCKTSCAWSANTGSVTSPARSCAAVGNVTIDPNTQSGCNGGNAYVCNDQQPFVRDGQAYAFAAANVNGIATTSLCCACYRLSFTNTAISGRNLIVQVINTGSDLNSNQFDLQFPGGGVGQFTGGCPRQWPNTPTANWGAQNGGVSQSLCDQGLPQVSDKATTPPREQQEQPKIKTHHSYDRVPRKELTPTKVRGKRRKNLPGYACEECENFYKASGLTQKDIQQCTRHRGPKRPRTPEGYWDPSWRSPTKTPKKNSPEKLPPRKSLKECDCNIM
ncbi:endoglucanase-like [Thrips palmi]|uniref:Cellulase n=1 Tax=Thrips palmi TaxID=161013 RepID=A0A6P8Y9F3_THRPL|nr:endoglucanase-like [Thrips palmi]